LAFVLFFFFGHGFRKIRVGPTLWGPETPGGLLWGGGGAPTKKIPAGVHLGNRGGARPSFGVFFHRDRLVFFVGAFLGGGPGDQFSRFFFFLFFRGGGKQEKTFDVEGAQRGGGPPPGWGPHGSKAPPGDTMGRHRGNLLGRGGSPRANKRGKKKKKKTGPCFVRWGKGGAITGGGAGGLFFFGVFHFGGAGGGGNFTMGAKEGGFPSGVHFSFRGFFGSGGGGPFSFFLEKLNVSFSRAGGDLAKKRAGKKNSGHFRFRSGGGPTFWGGEKRGSKPGKTRQGRVSPWVDQGMGGRGVFKGCKAGGGVGAPPPTFV